MARFSLAVLDALKPQHPTTCDDCGACCQTVGTPPGFYALWCCAKFLAWVTDAGSCTADEAAYYASMSSEQTDYDKWTKTAPELRGVLERYYAERRDDETPDRYDASEPCLWFDVETRRCRNYDLRPDACRDEVTLDDEYCLGHRDTLRDIIREHGDGSNEEC